MKKYQIINVVIILTTFFYLFLNFSSDILSIIFYSNKKLLFLLIIFLILGVYFIKGVRFYFLMLEQKIETRRFFKLYLKTTMINLILPFKLGEAFKIYCYGEEIKSYKTSIICVLIDRYFDTIPLFFILGIISMSKEKNVSAILVIILGFMLICSILYFLFNSFYFYTNRFLIMNSYSKNVINYLIILEKLKKEKDNIKLLLKNKVGIYLLLSTLAWIFELINIYVVSYLFTEKFLINIPINYISSIFSGDDTLYTNFYKNIGILLLILVFFTVYTISIIKERKNG